MKAFVLAPFDDASNRRWSSLLQPAIKEAGYEAKRADSVQTSRNILQDVVTGIYEADIIIADLTGMNPNVMYELGIAHALHKPTLMISDSLESVPFDLRAYRIIEFSWDYDLASKFKDQLTEILNEHASGEWLFGNPVTDFTPSGSSRELVAVPSEDDSPGLLEALSELDGVTDVMMTTFDGLTTELNNLERDTSTIMQELNASRGQMTQQQWLASRITMAKQVSELLDHHVSKVDDHMPGFKDSMTALQHWAQIISDLSPLLDRESSEFSSTRKMLSELENSSTSMAVAIAELGDSVKLLKRVSRGLSKSVTRVLATWNTIRVEAEAVAASCHRALVIMSGDS